MRLGSTLKLLRAVACVVPLMFGAGCADLGGLFAPAKPDPAAEMPALEARIGALVREERQKLDPKAQALAFDPELMDVARLRSEAMAKNNSFSGGSSDTHVSASLLMSRDKKFQGLVGENVAAQHYTKEIGIDVEAFAKRFVEGWMASAPHRENLMFTDYNRTGVGAAVNGDTVYVTQLFATDLGLGPQGDSAPPSQVTPVANPQQGKDDSLGVPLRGAIAPGVSSE